MKAIFLNGSPRKKKNTVQILQSAMKGAEEAGAETELVHLFDLNCKGCVSCFACKLKNSRTNGICALKDEVRPVLEKCFEADVIVFGSPIYYGYPTAQMRAFWERMMFPLDSYELDENGVRCRYLSITKPTAMIYTMNVPENMMDEVQYPTILSANSNDMERLFGYCENLYVNDTYQYDDYSRYAIGLFDEKLKAKHREEHFPIDLQNAYDLGKRLVEKAKAGSAQ